MHKYKWGLVSCAATAILLLAGGAAAAAEIGNVCWQTEKGTLLRFSISEAGAGHYTYTGMFDDGDGARFAISGAVEIDGNTLVGSFSGSKTTSSDFKTAIYRVMFDGNLVGTAEGIRHKYDRSGAFVSSDYRSHTLTPKPCP